MTGREIYQSLCESRDLDAAVSRLTREQLAEVAQHLTDLVPIGGLPAMVFGMVSARLCRGARVVRKTKTGGKP